MPSLGSAVTWLHQELPADSLAESLAATVCRMPSLALELVCPGPQQSLEQRKADPKPLQPWGQSWAELRPLSVTFGRSLPILFPLRPQ